METLIRVLWLVAGAMISLAMSVGSATLKRRLKTPSHERRVMRFWRSFDKDVGIIVVGHPVDGYLQPQKRGIVMCAGFGAVIALALVLPRLRIPQSELHEAVHFSTIPDEEWCRRKNLIIIGGGRDNPAFETLQSLTNLPYKYIDHRENTANQYKEITNEHGTTVHTPTIDGSGRAGTDFAVVAKTRNPNDPKRHLLFIAGAYTFGTLAAAQLITDGKLIEAEKVSDVIAQDTFEIVLEVPIQNGQPGKATALERVTPLLPPQPPGWVSASID